MTGINAIAFPPADVRTHERLVVIGASAGGIEALQTILPALPPDFSAPIVLVLHRSARHTDLLASVLSRHCKLPVKLATEGEILRRGIVYIAPANRHVSIMGDRRLQLHDERRINFLHSSADPLFESAARAYGANAIGVVLSGGGHNGAAGARAIYDAGGVVIAQNEATSPHFSMPRAAIAAGAVTSVLPLDQIAERLRRLTSDGAAPVSAPG